MAVCCEVCHWGEGRKACGIRIRPPIPMRWCAGCDGFHAICALCAGRLGILGLTSDFFGNAHLSACPAAAQVARELMGDK